MVDPLETAALRNNLRQLIELERGFGSEWMLAPASSASTVAAPVPAPSRTLPATPPPPRAVAAQSVVLATATATAWAAPADLTSRPPAEALALIAEETAICQRCRLCSSRQRSVPGEGNPTPELLFIGEGPDEDEDRQGRPFVGAAGELLDKMIVAMGLRRSEVFIANTVKCRPPGNRNPEPDELAACLPFLMAQVAVLRPKVICTLGNVPLRVLFGADTPGITRARGIFRTWQGIAVMPTFHPSYLLRNQAGKKPAWEDLKQVVAALGRTLPAR